MIGKLLVGAAAILALVGLTGRKTSTSSPSKPIKPSGKPKPSSGTTTKPTGGTTPAKPSSGKENTALTSAEQLELQEDTANQLYASAMISPHKVFVVAAASKLATAGDTRAADLTERVANWSSSVATANLTADEQAMINSPLDFTLDGIIAQASQSTNANFVRWASSYVRAQGRTDSADVLDQQYQSMTGA